VLIFLFHIAVIVCMYYLLFHLLCVADYLLTFNFRMFLHTSRLLAIHLGKEIIKSFFGRKAYKNILVLYGYLFPCNNNMQNI
ncbi:hypothetical protein VIGAN_03298000, partial [Vigna angularis var. angularis]